MSKPVILVTNDDGITSPGIRMLVEIASTYGEVIVCAPNSPQSGQGHAITLEHPIKLKKSSVFPGVEAYECSGTPVDCVKLAKHIILKDRHIDLCLSGINHGSNASINIIYSGTMSAAMEASIEGIDSIGFSFLDFSYDTDYSYCLPFLHKLVSSALEKPFPASKLINVNIPKGEVKGIKVCRQCDGTWIEEFLEGKDPKGEAYYWLTGKFHTEDEGDDHDIAALEKGYISVVPSHHDLTHYPSLEQFKYLENL